MRSHVVPLAAFALVLLHASAAAAQQTATLRSPEERRAQVVAQALEAGRVAEALIEAEGGVKQFPRSPLLRRRLAQAHLCVAIERDRQFGSAVDDITYSHQLDMALRWVRNPETIQREHERAEKFAK